MDEQVDFSNGGMAVVMVPGSKYVQEYTNHPRVKHINCAMTRGDELEAEVPNNTKAVLMQPGLPNYHSTWIQTYCRRKNIPYIIRQTNQALLDMLNQFFREKPVVVTQEDALETITKGKLNVLIPLIDFTKSNTENARILLRKAEELGIKTTEGSLAQFVSNNRRKSSNGTIPKSARPKLDLSVDLLDNMIKELGDMRDFLIATCEENRILKTKLEKFRKAMDE